jgi:hypothetical protein
VLQECYESVTRVLQEVIRMCTGVVRVHNDHEGETRMKKASIYLALTQHFCTRTHESQKGVKKSDVVPVERSSVLCGAVNWKFSMLCYAVCCYVIQGEGCTVVARSVERYTSNQLQNPCQSRIIVNECSLRGYTKHRHGFNSQKHEG